MQTLLEDRVVERLRAAQGVIRLGERYGAELLEAACARALAYGCTDYKTVKGILKNGSAGGNESFDFGVSGDAYQGRSRFAPTKH